MAAIPLLLLFLSVSSSSVNGNNTAPAVDCSAAMPPLVKCLPFVTNGSHVEKPEDSCCSGLKTVLDTKPDCLCEALKKSKEMGISLNFTKSATLPAACKLTTTTSCSLFAKPPVASAPAPVPAAGPLNGSGPGSSSAPAPSPSRSNRGSSVSVLPFAISGVLVILFALV
ncbi:unnamed protein product [Eruca vesicaria subsp. sativa]|uniref:Bifunctional inhibitor/plant lipid transfer protein/seed storage helical domain-containing protein n=1 Tax=Eruca vesicaria subsp. sativa TaxID=29727 RepID=A0ABC8K6V4_ERUVS|nr:unnamed protein product [Eruca vesicaria subsp. sativa]